MEYLKSDNRAQPVPPVTDCDGYGHSPEDCERIPPPVTAQESFAEKLYACGAAVAAAEDELVNHVLRIVGVRQDDFASWPFSYTSYDSYDYSFELKGVRPGFILTSEQQQQLWELGFDQCWLNYTDKWEMWYSSRIPQGSIKDPTGKFSNMADWLERIEKEKL